MTRRTRQYVTTPDGVEHAQTTPPRADVLHYPGGWVTILVRRTQDETLARDLALAALADLDDLDQHAATGPDGPTLGRARHGWWTTVRQSERRALLPGEALDAWQRCVAPCAYDAPGAGAGIEFLAGRTR